MGGRTMILVTRLWSRGLDGLAAMLWRAGDLAGFACTACYRLAGRLTGMAFEVRRR